jgi:hypothetical protein
MFWPYLIAVAVHDPNNPSIAKIMEVSPAGRVVALVDQGTLREQGTC